MLAGVAQLGHPVVYVGAGNSTAFLSASVIRPCQPGPSDLNASRTSGSRRIVVDTFVTFVFGLPRRTGRASITLAFLMLMMRGAAPRKVLIRIQIDRQASQMGTGLYGRLDAVRD